MSDDDSIDIQELVSDVETKTILDLICAAPAYVTPPEDERVVVLPVPNQKKRARFAFSDQLVSPAKRSKTALSSTVRPNFIVKGKEMRAFFHLLGELTWRNHP